MTTAHSRSYAQRTPFDVAAHLAVLEAMVGCTVDRSESITAPDERWATDSDADHNERRDTAMRERQEAMFS